MERHQQILTAVCRTCPFQCSILDTNAVLSQLSTQEEIVPFFCREELEGMSLRELRQLLKRRGVRTDSFLEMSELREAARRLI